MEESKQNPARREGSPLPAIDRGMKSVRRPPPFWRPPAPSALPPGFGPSVPAQPKPAAAAPASKVPGRPAPAKSVATAPAAKVPARQPLTKPTAAAPGPKVPVRPTPPRPPPQARATGGSKPAAPVPQPKLAQPKLAQPKLPPPKLAQPKLPPPKFPLSKVPARPARPEPPPKPSAPAAASNAPRPISGIVYSRRYKLEQVIGRGGRGTVYKAWDNVLGINVALKFLPPGVALKPASVEEIRREAVVTMRLAHENIVRLHNVEMTGQRLFLVMEYVDGENLRQVLDRLGALAPSSVADIARSCADALAYAHRVGIVHRDLKPENLMIDKDAVLKIVDLGTAVMARTTDKDQYMEGTPGYMSPEQIRGGELVDARTDVYSLGAVLAELLTGKRAFVYDGELQHLLDARPRGLESLPPDVRTALIKAMEPDREARWASVAEFCQALTGAIEGAGAGA